jgi:hypothetical protein
MLGGEIQNDEGENHSNHSIVEDFDNKARHKI